MKLSNILPLAVTATAIVLPEAEVMQQIAIEDNSKHNLFNQVQSSIPTKDQIKHAIEDAFSAVFENSKNAFDEAVDWASKETNTISTDLMEEYFDAKSWIEFVHEDNKRPLPHSCHDKLDNFAEEEAPPHGPPRDGPPHDGPPHGKPPHDREPHDGPPHGKPPHDRKPHEGPPRDGKPPHGKPHGKPPHGKPPHGGPPPHGPQKGKPRRPHRRPHKSNQTVYEMINSSKYTTKLAGLINEDSDLVKLLKSTKANFTIFAPTDNAFEKIPDHHRKPSKEFIKKLLSYHVSDEFYPAGRIFVSRTVPTLLEGTYLSSDPKDTPQRISTSIGIRGLTLNFYSRVVAPDIFGSNGVIHGIDSILLPPPSAARIITLLPSDFSTLELALYKTGLFDALNSTSGHLGGTLFAPSNWAFTKLGPKINAFLFSEYGRKYLKALLEYHVVANQTLYSDAFYGSTGSELTTDAGHRIPRGKYHVDLPTLLEGKHLSIDIGRFGRLIDIRINGFAHVAVTDGIAKDGVIHVLSNVLIPPKKPTSTSTDYHGEDLTVDDLKERLEDYVQDEDDQEKDKNDL